MFFGTFELSEQVSAEKNPAYGTDTGQEYETDEDHGFGRLGGTEGNGGGLDYGVDRRVLLYLGLGELELPQLRRAEAIKGQNSFDCRGCRSLYGKRNA